MANKSGKLPVVFGRDPRARKKLRKFRDALAVSSPRQADYMGGNIRLREIAENLLDRHPAVLVAGGGGFIAELKAATSIMPIVFISGLDPISSGFVESFNRPRGYDRHQSQDVGTC
jgi:hypothetical protein